MSRSAIRGSAHEALTSAEAGQLLCVSAATVKRWADEGALRSTRTRGGHRRFRREEVEAFAIRLQTSAQKDSYATLADRLAARDGVLRVQADLLAERARGGSWEAVVEACELAVRTLANSEVTRPPLSSRIAHAILADAVTRCAEELPTVPGARTLVIAAVDREPPPVALSLARLVVRAAGWAAWSVGIVPARELAESIATRGVDALLLWASFESLRADITHVVENVRTECSAAGVPLAIAGNAPWPRTLDAMRYVSPRGTSLDGFRNSRSRRGSRTGDRQNARPWSGDRRRPRRKCTKAVRLETPHRGGRRGAAVPAFEP